MEFPGEIVANIIEQRINLSSNPNSTSLIREVKDHTLQQISHILSHGLSIDIDIILTSDKCLTSSSSECKSFYPIERWNIQRLKENEVKAIATPPLLPIFLKNAIRSQLHFSPINSWLSQNDKKFPEDIKCSHRISANNSSSLKLPNDQIETHKFPFCKFETLTPEKGEYLAVKVEWIRLNEFPKLDACYCKPNNSANLWVLPTDNLQTSTEDEEGDFTSSPSPSFPSSPNEHNTKQTILTENEVQVLTDFLSTSSIQTISEKPKRHKRKSSSKDIDNNEEEIDSDHTLTRRHRRSRRCTTASVVAEIPSPPSPLRQRTCKSFSGVSTAFNPKTRLPLNSSPSPLKRTPMSLASKLREKFTANDGDSSSSDSEYIGSKNSTIYGSSQSNNGLLCNYEESILNGRIEPVSSIDGFKLQLSVSGSSSVPHTVIPVTTYFFDVSDDNAPSLYLGHCSFKDSPFGRKAIHIPKKCIIQATLFNPQGSVIHIFIVRIDVSDIPTRSKTFIRQRTCATAVNDDKISSSSTSSVSNLKLSILRYLINLRLATDRAGKLYLHTDIRLLFSNNHTDIDIMNLIASDQTSKKRGMRNSNDKCCCNNSNNLLSPVTYELVTTTEMPQKPKYSPIK
jgi:hypothetical protein